MKGKKREREVAVIDFETDPFAFGRVPAPFAAGFMWRGVFVSFVGPDCAADLVAYLREIDVPLYLYAHNGGKFDFYFLHEFLNNPLKIISGRIVSAKLGIHELRDSWSILPFPLAAYKKTEIDYAKFEPEVRHEHMPEILAYLRDDCADLYDLCSAFVRRFGPRLTIAGTAMRQLLAFGEQENTSESHDARFRGFYFGGRVECFAAGILRGKWKVYDVNSMYPAVMKHAVHPLGKKYLALENPLLDSDGWIAGYPGRMYFCRVTGVNYGALPVRGDGPLAGLDFNQGFGLFETTSHELRAALELGRFEVVEVHSALIPMMTQRFGGFVDHFTAEKQAAAKEMKAAEKKSDTVAFNRAKIPYWFAKLILNSAYGKFGQNPEHFKEYAIRVRDNPDHDDLGKALSRSNAWQLEQSADNWSVWSKPTPMRRYYDVAIAASVTSAARAVLLRGLAGATKPVYCDTDSIVCENLGPSSIDDFKLGAWKLEAIGTRIAIAGKKLYALFDGKTPVKWASKGAKLDPREIEKIAKGGEVEWQSDAPNFNLSGRTKFISRKARKTA